MTKEAKIGLLLGLMFIIGIAIVLRGMHRNSQAALEKELLAGNTSAIEPSGPMTEAVNLSAVNELSQSDNATASIEEVTAVETETTAKPTSASTVAAEGQATATPSATPVVATDETVRHVQELPGGVSNVAVVPPSGSAIDHALANLTEPVHESAVPVVAVTSTEPSKVYEVKDGDDLTRIARNVYGEQQGKRWANIKRIFDANKSTMATMDSLKIGQKLTIPALPKDAAAAPAVTTVASTASTPKATATPAKGATSEKASASMKAEKAEKSEKTAGYVVKEGDSLWKIAKEKLGDGSRSKEIMKLNGLSSDSKLKNGMRLKLPSK